MGSPFIHGFLITKRQLDLDEGSCFDVNAIERSTAEELSGGHRLKCQVIKLR